MLVHVALSCKSKFTHITPKGALLGVNMIVNIQSTLACKGLAADIAGSGVV